MDIHLIKLLPGEIIFLRRCPYICLFKEVKLLVVINECPDTDIKLSSSEKERCLNIFLYDEGVVLDLFYSFISSFSCVWVCLFLILCYLTRKLLNLFIALGEIFIYGRLFVCSSTLSIGAEL